MKYVVSFIVSLPTWISVAPIIVLWIVTLAVVLERFLFFRRRKVSPKFFETLDNHLQKGEWLQADKISIVHNSPAAQCLVPAFNYISKNLEQSKGQTEFYEKIDEAVQMAGAEQVALLEKNLAVLSTVATIAPLFGLLGTVTGMLKSFFVLAHQSTAITHKFASGIASGITEALITTFLGLIVAIPAYIFYNYFVRKIDGFTQDMGRSHYIVKEHLPS